MKKYSIIFDLDGTLWEVIDSTYKSANEVTKKHGLQEITRETVCKGFGLNKEESAKLFFPYLELEKSKELIDEISNININNLMINGGNLYPNLKETLDILNEKYNLYIVSNTARTEYIEAFLIPSNTKEYFKDYIAASKLGISKADAIRKAVIDNGIEEAAYVGDTLKDLEAARQAGVSFIQAKYGFGEDLKTEYFIDEFNELPEVLEKVFKKNE